MGPVKVPLCVFVNVRLSIVEHFVPLAGRDLRSDFKSDANAKWYLSRRLGRQDAVIQPQRLASVAHTPRPHARSRWPGTEAFISCNHADAPVHRVAQRAP